MRINVIITNIPRTALNAPETRLNVPEISFIMRKKSRRKMTAEMMIRIEELFFFMVIS